MSDIDAIHGAQYIFGLRAADTSGFTLTGFTCRGVATSDVEPEIFVTATNGEGVVEAIAITAPASRMINVSLIGYIDSSFNRLTLGNTFSLFGRFFFVKKISDPRQKGAFVEVTIDGTSWKLITS